MITKEQAEYWFNKTTELSKFNKHKPLVEEIIKQTPFLTNRISLPQRLWHIINQTQIIPGCNMCSAQVSWDHRYKHYKTYCSKQKCPNTDPDVVALKNKNVNYATIVAKRQQTNLKRHGTTNFLASDVGKKKTLEGKLKKHGENFRQHEKTKREQTCLKRYGVKNVFEDTNKCEQFPDIKRQKYGSANNIDKIRQTNLKRYGVSNPMQSAYVDVIHLITNPDYLLDQHVTQHKPFEQISTELGGIDPRALINRVKTKYPEFVPTRFCVSQGEKQLSQFLTDNNIIHETNIRSLISPQELDIYIPEHKLAIEYCGLYWHSEQKGKGRNYHKNKMNACNQQGIQLLTIFEDEWLERKDQVCNKILHLLNVSNQPTTHPRCCEIRQLSTAEKIKFLDTYHIQGSGPGSITYGLIHNAVIVAAMSFINQKDNAFVLNRYATSCKVPGGFSKLLNHFKKHNTWKEIVSFADLRWSSGDLYDKTGWTLDNTIPPDYAYSLDGIRRSHKFNYRRKNLPKLLAQFDPTLSETENCDNNGVLRIWDCGKLRYIIINQQKII